MSSFWLFNNKTNVKIDQIPLETVVTNLIHEDKTNLLYWYAWQPGWENWKTVNEVSEIKTALEKSNSITAPPPPPIAPPPLPSLLVTNVASSSDAFEVIETTSESKLQDEQAQNNFEKTQEIILNPQVEENTITSNIESTSSSKGPVESKNLRRHPRYNVRFKVIIENDVITFRTFTSNISISGVALEHAIPEKLLNNNCRIFISDLHKPETIAFTIKPVNRGNSDLKYFSFDNLDDNSVKKLESWLERLVNNLVMKK